METEKGLAFLTFILFLSLICGSMREIQFWLMRHNFPKSDIVEQCDTLY